MFNGHTTRATIRGVTVFKDAEISHCKKYRYCLWREWDIGRAVTFVMLNPSTADANFDDPTIRRCIGFAKNWGFSKLVVVNVFAFRATNPRDLPISDIAKARGRKNSYWLEYAATYSELIIPAWGVPKPGLDLGYWYANTTIKNVAEKHRTPVECLGLTMQGAPRHPLYVPYGITRTKWNFNK